MYWLMVCRHKQGCEKLRDELRPLHREHVRTGGNGLARVLIGSALLAPDGSATGNFGVIEAANEQSARAFADGDPFAQEITESIELIPLPDTFQAHRIDPMSDVILATS